VTYGYGVLRIWPTGRFCPAHEALLTLLKFDGQLPLYNVTVSFAGGQQTKENTRTTFDNDFCHNSHDLF